MAQVYSINTVGYVNVTLPAGQNVLVANPLDNGTNTLNDVAGLLPAKSGAQFWTGAGFTPSSKGATWSPNTAVPVGVGFFLKTTVATNITFVGQVSGYTNNPAPLSSGQTTTNHVPAGLNILVGSPIPFSGFLNDTNIGLNIMPAKSGIQFWTGSGYTPSSKGATWSPNSPISPAQGFFLKANSATNWIQTMP